MATIVTLDVYSGRPNPTWMLSDEQDEALTDRQTDVGPETLRRSTAGLGLLGYRGFLLTRTEDDPLGPLSMRVHEGLLEDRLAGTTRVSGSPALESFLLLSGPAAVDDELRL